jgi:hypothetical protein
LIARNVLDKTEADKGVLEWPDYMWKYERRRSLTGGILNIIECNFFYGNSNVILMQSVASKRRSKDSHQSETENIK